MYGYRERSLEDKKRAVYRHKNKQYQWLLSEAYELFEDFIETTYAYAGYTDRSFWPLKDFGNVSLAELEEKDFTWFVHQAKIPQREILSRYRKKFPQLVYLETQNRLNINLSLAVVLIENLRHIIVHKKGIISNRRAFIEKVLKASGLYNNGNFCLKHTEFIEKFFGSGEYENTIYLLEVPVDPAYPDTYVDTFENLSNYLLAYAHLVMECLTSHTQTSLDAAMRNKQTNKAD